MEPNNSKNNQLVVFGENISNINQQENNQNPIYNTMRFVQYKNEVILNDKKRNLYRVKELIEPYNIATHRIEEITKRLI